MRKFLIRMFKFSMLPVILFMATFIFYKISKQKTDEELHKLAEYQCLLAGDSQMQRIREDFIKEKTKNIASSAEHYYFTYQKLLTMFESKDSKIDKVVLGVSIHSFAPVYNRLFDINFPEGKNSLERYLYFIHFFDDSDFFTNHNQLFGSAILCGIYSSPDWGGVNESTKSNPDTETINHILDMHYTIKQGEDKFCYSQKKYLYKIDSLCVENNVELILVSTPYLSEYTEKIAPEYLEYFSETLLPLKHRCHLNFLEDKIEPDLMSDANHLNILGAKKYSEIIGKEIQTRMYEK